MTFDITELPARFTMQYPYTHRISVFCKTHEFEKIVEWLTDQKIQCSVLRLNQVLYLPPEYTTLFVLTWANRH